MYRLIDTAMGRIPADTLFINCKVINVFNGEIEKKNIAVSNGYVVGFGDYEAKNIVDLKGSYVTPGLIDTHAHIESTMMSPANYAHAIMPYGVTTAVADPHEIANVLGIRGVDYMIDESLKTPMDIKFMLPSCVPATMFEDSGAEIDAETVERSMKRDNILGLGEVMNYPGVYFGDRDVLRKIAAARKAGKIVDGHYPDPKGKKLYAYIIPGISTDHESVDSDSAAAKLANGLYVQMREGSSTKNVKALLPIINKHSMRRCLFCTDDKNCAELLKNGHLDYNVRLAVENGIDIIDALIIASYNAAECYNFKDRGAISPGRIADFVVFDDPAHFEARQVYKNGKLVAENQKALYENNVVPPKFVTQSMNTEKITPESLELRVSNDTLKVMRLIPNNVVTEKLTVKCNVENGVYKNTKGISKVAVVERHKRTGKIGLGLLADYNIEGGAIALSISHDSHNIIAVGDNDADMALAVNNVISCGGGITAVKAGETLGTFELPIAGLMCKGDVDFVTSQLEKMNRIAYNDLNVNKNIEAFMALSFLSLAVIPSLKLTARGLFDVDKFSFCTIEA